MKTVKYSLLVLMAVYIQSVFAQQVAESPS